MYILASQSPRRKELMTRFISSDFIIVPSNVKEVMDERNTPNETAKINALIKGIDVFKKYPNDTVISADTIVVYDGHIFGKPKDKEDAQKILTTLSGKTHEVITGYFIKNKDFEILKSVSSYVTFKELSDEIIESYIETGCPMDKAGAYGIQDEISKKLIIKEYIGSLNNIIGFPIEEILKDLK